MITGNPTWLQRVSQSPSYRGSLSYTEAFPAGDGLGIVSIPFLSGQSFLPGLLQCVLNHCFNESQSPSYRGSLSYAASETASVEAIIVSIPFLSGQSFLLGVPKLFPKVLVRLNPLPIGAVFPTRQLRNRSRSKWRVSIPFLSGQSFLRSNFTSWFTGKVSQSPSYRGSLSYSHLSIPLTAKRLQAVFHASPIAVCQNPKTRPSTGPPKSLQVVYRQLDSRLSRICMAK